MTEEQLQQLCREVHQALFEKKIPKIKVEFSSSRSLRHTIHAKWGTVYVKISGLLCEAPPSVLKALCAILFLKLYRFKVDRKLYKIYTGYLEAHPEFKNSIQRRAPSARYTAVGQYFDLNEIFDSVNQAYFGGELARPILGWSLRKAYRRLGFYNKEKNLLVISRIFDSKKVPRKVVEYLMYHEMLHIAIPTVHNNGRRTIHGRSFREKERQFPQYEFVQKWLTKNLRKL